MNTAKEIIKRFGGQSVLAELIGKNQSTVQYWAKKGTIPAKWQKVLLNLAEQQQVALTPHDFINQTPETITPDNFIPTATHWGELQIGKATLPCFILDTGERVINMRATVKAISDRDHGNLGNLIGGKALKPYINSDLVLGKAVSFQLPGVKNLPIAKGITAEHFLDICRAYVEAFTENELETNLQKQVALKCSILLASCAKVGLIALIDEATGYQYERAIDALQFKLKLYLEEEMRQWEKTFPDALWEEFGRLTNWRGKLHERPKYWGKLVMELVYDYLDKDVADWLRDNAPKPQGRQNYHQWLTSQYGLKQLTEHIWMLVGMARSCVTMRELRERMAIQYGRQNVQLNLFIPPPTRKPIK